MMNSAAELMDKGFACLVEKLGVVDAEQISEEAASYARSHTHRGRGVRV